MISDLRIMPKVLFTNPEKCVGCMLCVLACSMLHGSTVAPTRSRLLPIRLRALNVNVLVVCRQCIKPLCADVCPMGAISRAEKTGAMVVDADRCIACGMCMVVCPLGGISIDAEAGHSVKCDLCGGEPLCAKFCSYGALEYITLDEAALRRRKEAIRKLSEMLQKIAFG